MNAMLLDRFRDPALQRLRVRLERQLRTHGQLSKSVTLRDVSPAERTALEALTSQTSQGVHFRVDVNLLQTYLQRSGHCQSLAELVEAAAGQPLRELSRQHRQRTHSWQQITQDAASQVHDCPALVNWLKQLRRSGQLKKATKSPAVGRQLLDDVLRIVRLLPRPVRSSESLSMFAAECCGDAHGLDSDTVLGRLVIQAVAAILQLESPRRAADRRRVWEAAGIVPDELSATVLVWNLPSADTSATAQALNANAAVGEPLRLTFAQLRRQPVNRFSVPTERPIFVCENPNVVAAAAAQLGASGGPLVCVEGQPNLAVLKLLRQLADDGFRLLYHGDFDWGGIRIANFLMRQMPVQPWRFGAADYVPELGKRRLRGIPVTADWDPELSLCLQRCGFAIHEEAVLAGLLADLRH